MVSRIALVLNLLFLCVFGAATAAEPIGASHAPALAQKTKDLRTRLDQASANPTRQNLKRIERQLAEITRLVDIYFHGSNLVQNGARPHALRLRTQVHALLGGKKPLLVVRNDAFHFSPRVLLPLARAWERLRVPTHEVVHLLAAIEAGAPALDVLPRLQAVFTALKRPRAATRVAEKIADLMKENAAKSSE